MILAILQARITSTRLPGKVLKDIIGKPMLIHEVERIRNSKLIDKIVVATSCDKSDDILVKVCQKYNIDVFRGNLDNVLERYYYCAREYKADSIVRLTGDCPVIDWEIIDKVIQLHLKEHNDYTSNTVECTYPDGLDVEVMSYETLKKVYMNAKLPSELEHVTKYIYNHSNLFKIGCLKNETDLSKFRLTVDQSEDLEVIKLIFEYFHNRKDKFLLNDVVGFLKNNQNIVEINSNILRNEGLIKSLERDKVFKEE